jgi:hypothetical protein
MSYFSFSVAGVFGGPFFADSSPFFIRRLKMSVVVSPRFFLMASIPRETGPRLVQ